MALGPGLCLARDLCSAETAVSWQLGEGVFSEEIQCVLRATGELNYVYRSLHPWYLIGQTRATLIGWSCAALIGWKGFCSIH